METELMILGECTSDAEQLVCRRRGVHLTQDRLARAAGISLYEYHLYESGKRPIPLECWKRLHDVLAIYEHAEQQVRRYLAEAS